MSIHRQIVLKKKSIIYPFSGILLRIETNYCYLQQHGSLKETGLNPNAHKQTVIAKDQSMSWKSGRWGESRERKMGEIAESMRKFSESTVHVRYCDHYRWCVYLCERIYATYHLSNAPQNAIKLERSSWSVLQLD